MSSILNSYVKNDFQAVGGDAWKETWPINHWDEAAQQWVPLPLTAVQSIVCTARNEGDNAIVNSRSAQDVFNTNEGTFVTGFFSFFFQPADTALIGSAALVDQETHQFAFTITLTNGTKTTISVSLYCFAAPAVSMTVPGNVGRVLQVLRNYLNESDPCTVTDELLTTYYQRGMQATNERTKYCVKDYTPADQVVGPLVAGTPNYDLPAAVNEILFAYAGTQNLTQNDFKYLMSRQVPVAVVETGTPNAYIQFGRQVYLDPPPNAAAAAATPYLWLRCWVDPPPLRLYGPYLLPSQFYDVPALWAAAEWMTSPYGNKPAVAKGYLDLFNARVGAMAEYYSGREGR